MTDANAYVVNVEVAIHRDGEYLLVERAPTEDHAAGELALVGGTVDPADEGQAVLASTARREVREEVGCELGDLQYVTSAAFVADTGNPVVNAVFVGEHERGEPHVREPEEVAAVEWYTPAAMDDDPAVPPYTREYVAAAQRRRRSAE